MHTEQKGICCFRSLPRHDEQGEKPPLLHCRRALQYHNIETGERILDRDRRGWNRSQRMQMKAFICVLGFLLIIILLFGKLLGLLIHRGAGDEEEPEPSVPHIPVVETFSNVWILEEKPEGILIFRDGERMDLSFAESLEEGVEAVSRPAGSLREQVADVTLTDGLVTEVVPKTTKINGRILSANEGGIEVEGFGRLPLAADYKGYRLYDSLEMCTAADLRFGYDFTDFCVENGEICGILMVKEEAMEYIRVLIRSGDYEGILHSGPVVTADTDFTVTYGAYGSLKEEKHQAGEEITFSPDSAYFEGSRVWITPEVLTGKVVLQNVGRSQGTPSYRGKMELLLTEGGIAVINEVLLEEYLYSVVPSEMPSSYPGEALKAQAVCARTYAYGHMEHAGYPKYGAHVDDSTSYQVYNNILEQESTTTAVKETYGQLLYTAEGNLAGTYYYSTSCGMGSEATIWKTETAPTLTYLKAKALSRSNMEQAVAVMSGGLPVQSIGEDMGALLQQEEAFVAFITAKNPDDFEYGEGWYRWTYQVEKLDRDHLLKVLQKRYEANSSLVLTWDGEEYVSKKIDTLDEIIDIRVEKRGRGGIADELVIETKSQQIKVISEHNIRYVLNDGKSKIIRQDGSKIASPNLLPSGFFVINTGKENQSVVGYTLTGGGFGHGVGMSQNGARAMAGDGYSAREMLQFFYEGCQVRGIYGDS